MNRAQKEKALHDCRFVAQFLAFQTWKRLPMQFKSCIDLDDLVQEARTHIWFEILPYYRKDGGAQLTTFVYGKLRQHFINQTIYYRAQKRQQPKKIDEPVVLPVFAFESYQLYRVLYERATPSLQQVLSSAIGTPLTYADEVQTLQRFRLTGKKWKTLKAEFNELRSALGELHVQFTLADAELLQRIGNDLLVQNYA